MFDRKYKKALQILNEEESRTRYAIHLCTNRDFEKIKNLEIRDELISENLKMIDSYLDKLEVLTRLKKRFKSEIGE